MLNTDQLHKYRLFEGLREDELARLLPHLRKRTYARQIYLFYPGAPGVNTYLIESGLVRLFLTNADGQEFLLNLVKPQAVFGLPIVQEDQLRLMGAATYADSVILSIERAQLLQAMRTMPQLLWNLYHEVSRSSRLLLLHTRALVTLGLNERLAWLLLHLTSAEPEARTLDMPLNQTELAGWLGASRGRLNRAIGLLQQQGLIRLAGSSIVILDRAGLTNLARTGE